MEIKTGLKNLDQICKNGNIIVIFCPTASGKTSILNQIKQTARANNQSVHSCEINNDLHAQLRLCKNTSQIKLIDINYYDSRLDDDTDNELTIFRKHLVTKDQWAIITIPSNKCGYNHDEIYDKVDHHQIFRIADYAFSLSRNREAAESEVTNIKNRSGVDGLSFKIKFEPLVVTTTISIAEEINHPIAK